MVKLRSTGISGGHYPISNVIKIGGQDGKAIHLTIDVYSEELEAIPQLMLLRGRELIMVVPDDNS